MKRNLSLGFLICLFALTAAAFAGCGATRLPPQQAPKGLDLASGWSFERSGRGVEAFGLPQHAHAAPSATADVAPYLQATPVTSPRKVAAMASAKVAAPNNVEATPKPTPLPAAAKPQEAPQVSLLAANTATDTEQRYAARDGVAQEQKEFRGGDAIVITTGTVVLILLILLLVLLLT